MIIFLGDDDGYDGIIRESIKDKPDIVVSCQYRYKVPESLIKSHICVNIHYGMLPEFAGCHPIYHQIMSGNEAGATLHYMDEGFDSGDIIDISKTYIYSMTADDLYKKLKDEGLSLFKKYYKSILDGTAPRRKQDLSKRKYKRINDVDFYNDSYIDELDDKKIRAYHFKGKQYAKINVDGVWYNLRRED